MLSNLDPDVTENGVNGTDTLGGLPDFGPPIVNRLRTQNVKELLKAAAIHSHAKRNRVRVEFSQQPVLNGYPHQDAPTLEDTLR